MTDHSPSDRPAAPIPEREMFDEINALIGSVAKALEISEGEVVSSIEQGSLGMEMLSDETGARFLRVDYDGKRADIRQGVFMRHGEGE
jgi:hypothetical protein